LELWELPILFGAAPYRILDIASGPGEPGISIAKAFPHTHVIITDISQDMINKAKEQTAGLDNTECLVADSENLSQFADNSFDVVTCCFGFMYNADKEKAFRESYRVLKPGGSLIATYWLSMPAGAFTRAAMNAVVSQKSTRPSTHIINPMCMSKAGVVTALAEQANFTDLSFTESHYPFNFGQDEATVFAMITLPIHDMIAEAQQQGRHDAVEIGKKAFFKELNESSFVTKTEEGTIVHGNKFEMIVAKKSEK
jgi:ubiquinone/menaquinone biosynthesis C-methylase UbiE